MNQEQVKQVEVVVHNLFEDMETIRFSDNEEVRKRYRALRDATELDWYTMFSTNHLFSAAFNLVGSVMWLQADVWEKAIRVAGAENVCAEWAEWYVREMDRVLQTYMEGTYSSYTISFTP